jgi:hypothetical protein
LQGILTFNGGRSSDIAYSIADEWSSGPSLTIRSITSARTR